jgi:hypothetical protein
MVRTNTLESVKAKPYAICLMLEENTLYVGGGLDIRFVAQYWSDSESRLNLDAQCTMCCLMYPCGRCLLEITTIWEVWTMRCLHTELIYSQTDGHVRGLLF